MCNESPKAFQLACDKLLVNEEQVTEPAVSRLGPLTRKRRIESTSRRYEICIHCEKEYDVLEDGICVWHKGKRSQAFEDPQLYHLLLHKRNWNLTLRTIHGPTGMSVVMDRRILRKTGRRIRMVSYGPVARRAAMMRVV
jgi:hypothetical protein